MQENQRTNHQITLRSQNANDRAPLPAHAHLELAFCKDSLQLPKSLILVIDPRHESP
jgi:hypothetical protein